MTEKERNEKRKAAGYWQNLPEEVKARRRAYCRAYRAQNGAVLNAKRRKGPIAGVSRPISGHLSGSMVPREGNQPEARKIVLTASGLLERFKEYRKLKTT